MIYIYTSGRIKVAQLTSPSRHLGRDIDATLPVTLHRLNPFLQAKPSSIEVLVSSQVGTSCGCLNLKQCSTWRTNQRCSQCCLPSTSPVVHWYKMASSRIVLLARFVSDYLTPAQWPCWLCESEWRFLINFHLKAQAEILENWICGSVKSELFKIHTACSNSLLLSH